MLEYKRPRSHFFTYLIGIAGLSFVIVIHELGHFLAAKAFGVRTPVFSVGFGPALLKIPIRETIFQLAALPLGGYVEINQVDMAALSYWPKVIIILAGIAMNFIFAYAIFFYLARKFQPADYKNGSFRSWFAIPQRMKYILSTFLKSEGHGNFIGPIGIIQLAGKSLTLGASFFFLILALLSANIGFFNLLPLPFFDGGKLVTFTIEHFAGPISGNALNFIYILFFIILLGFTLLIGYKDIIRLRKR